MKKSLRHGINIKKSIAAIIIVGLMVACGIMSACARRQCTAKPLLTSPWGDNYAYSYTLPEQKTPVSVQATIAVVSPYYKEAETALIDPAYSKVAKGFSKSMAVDLDRILVAKSMTVKGPFATIEDMTYPDKKGADLTLTPRVFITTYIKDGPWQIDRCSKRMERDFEMRIGGWIAFEMREPLSNEKIWIKKMELEDIVVRDVEVYEAAPQRYEASGGPGPLRRERVSAWKTGEPLYSGKVNAIADALKKVYPTVMEKFWTYINTEEILNLKTKTKEIRDLKRY